MFRYIAIVWHAANPTQQEAAQQLSKCISSNRLWRNVLEQSGLRVWCTEPPLGPMQANVLPDGMGVVLGALFERRSSADSAPDPSARLEHKLATRIIDTSGRHLLGNYWGHYVAFLRRPQSCVWVLRDPSAGLDCFHCEHRGAHVYFSDVADGATLAPLRLSINYRQVAAHLVVPTMRTEHTALNGVRELIGGQCDEITDGILRTHTYWLPAQISQQNPIENFSEAAASLRQIVRSCVHTWASRYDNILHLLSGGIDSSIVLACLQDAPTRPTLSCLTKYSAGPGGGDERIDARLAAELAGCAHEEQPDNADGSLAILLGIAHSARPRMYLSCLNESHTMRFARERRAQVIITGVGGDALFLERRKYSLADYLQRHGFGRQFLTVAKDSARLQHVSVWAAVKAAVRDLRSLESTDFVADWSKYRQLLTPQAREIGQQEHGAAKHPWLRGQQRIPPGKLDQIALILHPMSGRSPLARPGDPVYLSVLASQPLMELCLRIPTYVLTAGGWTRAVARKAFAQDVPAKILSRRDKGNTSGFTERVFETNKDFVREHLLDGILVKEGLLDRDRLIEALSDQPTRIAPGEVLDHLSTEIWLRRWSEARPNSVAA